MTLSVLQTALLHDARTVNSDVHQEAAMNATPVTAVPEGVSFQRQLNAATSQNRTNADVQVANAELMSNAEVNTVSAQEILLNAERTIWYGTIGQFKKSAPSTLSANLMVLQEVARVVNTDAPWEVVWNAVPVVAVPTGI